MNTAIQLIAIGIAADNLLMAHVSGYGLHLLKSTKWITILFLLFTIQNQVLYWGMWFSDLVQPFRPKVDAWMSIGILGSIVIKMLYDLNDKRRMAHHIFFDTTRILGYALATSVYAFLLGSVAGWLGVEQHQLLIDFLPFIVLFMLLGLLIGKYRCASLLLLLNSVTIGLLLTGTGIIIFEKLK